MHMPTDRGRILAVLGPTNTGKTHFAMERMLAYESGMIGFPLRLLARENYERAVAIKGSGQVEPGLDWNIDGNACFKMAVAAVKSICNLINITQA